MDFSDVELSWFGDDIDADARAAAAQSLAATAAIVHGLRPLTGAPQRLLGELRKPDFSIRKVVQIIEGDPALATRVLKTVNSAAYFVPTRIASVERAVALLGSQAISDMSIGMSLLRLLDEHGTTSNKLISHAQTVASIVQYLTYALELPSESAFTCGLLHDIGKLLILQAHEAEYVEILATTTEDPGATLAAERKQFGFDHAVLGGHILRVWRLPDPISEVVALHHQPGVAFSRGGRCAQLVALVSLANQLAHEFATESDASDEECVASVCRSPAGQRLDLQPSQFEQIWPDLIALAQGGAIERPRKVVPARGDDANTDATATEASGERACGWCDTPSVSACQRCAAPVCAEHTPAEQQRCRRCEREFEQQLLLTGNAAGVMSKLWRPALFAQMLCVTLTVVMPNLAALTAMLALLLAPISAAPLIERARQHRLREAFLEEKETSQTRSVTAQQSAAQPTL